MSTGASLGNLGTATVNLTADDRELRQKLSDAESKIRAQVARNNLAIAAQRPLTLSADPAVAALAQVRTQTLISQNQLLQEKLDAVARTAARANAALADRAKAIAAARAQEEADKAAAKAAAAAAAATAASGGPAGAAKRAADEAARIRSEARRQQANRTQLIGQTLDDMQYVESQGLRPILNNIMQISPAIGIAMLASDQIVKRTVGSWGKLFEMLGYAPLKTTIETIEARLEVLKNKRVKIGVDYNELDTLQKKLEKLQKAKEAFEGSKEDTYTKGLSKEAKDIAGGMPGGSEALEKAVAEIESSEGRTRMTQEQMQKISDRYLGHPEKGKEAIEHEAGKMDREFAKEEVGKMLAGDADAIERMKNRAGRNPGAFAAKDAEGVTAAEALANMPKSKEEFRKRTQDDAESKARGEAESENQAAWNKAKERRKQDAAEPAKALEDAFSRRLIEALKVGTDEAMKKLNDQVQRHLETSGTDPKKAERMAGDVVDAMTKSIKNKIKEKALSEGLSEEDATAKLDAEIRKAEKAKADKAISITDFKPEVQSLDSFFNSLRTRTPVKDEGTDKIVKSVDEVKKATDNLGTIIKAGLGPHRPKYAP